MESKYEKFSKGYSVNEPQMDEDAKPYHWPTYISPQNRSAQFVDFDMSQFSFSKGYESHRFFARENVPIIRTNSTDMPLLFYKLHSSVQALFHNKEDLTSPIQKLLEYAGLQKEITISQPKLIEALLHLDIQIRTTDIAILNVLSLGIQSDEQKLEYQSDFVLYIYL